MQKWRFPWQRCFKVKRTFGRDVAQPKVRLLSVFLYLYLLLLFFSSSGSGEGGRETFPL